MGASVLGSLCAQQAPAAPAATTANQGTFTTSDRTFTIVVPDGWATQKEIQGIDAMFTAPPSAKGGGSQANINVISGELEPGMTLDNFYTMNVNGLPTELKGFKQVDSGSDKVDGVDTKWVRYTHKVGDLEIAVLQYFFVIGNKGYVVTLSSLGSAYDSYAPTFNKTVKSFKIAK